VGGAAEVSERTQLGIRTSAVRRSESARFAGVGRRVLHVAAARRERAALRVTVGAEVALPASDDRVLERHRTGLRLEVAAESQPGATSAVPGDGRAVEGRG